MSEDTTHHPSCKPEDRELVYHCNQCGLNEYAEIDLLDKTRSYANEKVRETLVILNSEYYEYADEDQICISEIRKDISKLITALNSGAGGE